MIVLEKKVVGKNKEESKCEDAVVVTEHFAAVIDGITSKSNIVIEGKLLGRIAVDILREAIFDLDPNISCEQAIIDMSKAIHDFYIEHNLIEKNNEISNNKIGANVILYSNRKHEIWSIGDCQCMINGKTYDFSKKVDTVIEEARALYIEALLLEGITEKDLLQNDTSREYILPLIKKGMIFQNRHSESVFDYGVLDGYKVNKKAIKIIKVELESRVVLATDGYPTLCNTLEESEKMLQKQLREDPLCYKKIKSTKGVSGDNISYDDRAFLSFIID